MLELYPTTTQNTQTLEDDKTLHTKDTTVYLRGLASVRGRGGSGFVSHIFSLSLLTQHKHTQIRPLRRQFTGTSPESKVSNVHSSYYCALVLLPYRKARKV